GGGRGGRGGGGGRNPSATVLVHHSMVKLPEKPMMPRLFDERVGYFTQGLTDYGTGEQQQLQLPEELMCNLIKYVVAHEVGHTLGFQHNMKASSTYTIEQIRDPKWVK